MSADPAPSNPPSQVDVLIIEDNRGDAMLISEAFEAISGTRVTVAEDGPSGLRHLRETRNRSGAPAMVVLDLNLPGMDGKEILATIRDDEELAHLPVVVLTTSSDRNDVQECYELTASCYVSKPIGLAAFRAALNEIVDFWVATAVLPPLAVDRDRRGPAD